MTLDVRPLFEPLQVRNKRLRNRIVMPPMVVSRGTATRAAAEWYGRHAQGGVALVIIEATDMTLFSEHLNLDGLRAQVEAIHAGGALAAIQLFPGVRGQTTAPADLSQAQLDHLIAGYRHAAEVCRQVGMDGIEPHGAHGFLLNQFFSPEKNRRADGYGGSLDNRMRLATEIVQAVRPICGDEMLLLYRHTPVGTGYGVEESLDLARALVEAGVDILDLSPSSHQAPGDLAAPFMGLSVPVITVNNLDVPEAALEALNEKRADLIAVGRGLIADPDWPIKVREGRFEEIVECIKCDHCFTDLRAGVPVGCTQWPQMR
jgi:2,4-dienoyl-CoA reductase-like NADH-dependent reductase (Old Yellow Enzyme family)